MFLKSISAIAALAALTVPAGSLFAQQPAPYGLNCTIADIKFGEHLSGPVLTPENLENHVVMVLYWSTGCPIVESAVPRVQRMHDEFEPQGLIVIGNFIRGTVDEAESLLNRRNITYTNMRSGDVTVKDCDRPIMMPHVFLFDHTGKCIYRGRQEEVSDILGRTMEAAPAPALAGCELIRLKNFSDALKAGRAPSWAVAEAAKLTASDDAQIVEEATEIIEAINKWGLARMKRAVAFKYTDARECVSSLQKLIAEFKGTEVETQAREKYEEMQKDKDFTRELKAYEILDKIKQIEKQLKPLRTAAGYDTISDNFRRRNASVLASMQNGIRVMKKTFAGTKAETEAVELGRKYGIVILD